MTSFQAFRDGQIVIDCLERAGSTLARMRGLLGRRRLPAGCGLHIEPCSAIHTWGMLFSIDALFLDRDRTVVRLVRDIRPYRLCRGGRGAYSVIEVTTGWLTAEAARCGDRIDIRTME